MGDKSTGDFGGKIGGGLGYGLAAKGDITAGYFDNSIQSSTGPSTEVNVNIPLTPVGIGVAGDASIAVAPNGGTGPIDSALQDNGINLPVDVQSLEGGIGLGGGAYVAETTGVALTSKGLYIGGKDVTQQGKALDDKAIDGLKNLTRREDE